jgi:hypothetical protein
MGMDFWERRSRRAASRSSPHHSREEAVVARRARPRLPTREIRITFEPSHISSACMMQAYEPVVPRQRRPTGAGLDLRAEEGPLQTQRVGRRHGS